MINLLKYSITVSLQYHDLDVEFRVLLSRGWVDEWMPKDRPRRILV